MFYRNVRIERDRMTVVTKLVVSHEIHVLKRVFDEGSVTVLPGWKLTRRPYGSAEDEYNRLRIVYGTNSETHHPFVYEAFHDAKGLWAAIPLWVRVLDQMLQFKMPSWRRMTRYFRKGTQLASIPAEKPELPAFDQLPVVRNTRFGPVNAGMLDAVNAAIKQVDSHNTERERFANERVD